MRRWHGWLACGQGQPCPACYPQVFDEIIESWDCAFKKEATNSRVAGQCWGRLHANVYLLDSECRHMDLPDTMRALVGTLQVGAGEAL